MSSTNPVVAFVVVMAVWTVSEYVARKTKSLLSSLFVASLIFLVGFLTGIFPDDLLASSSLLALAGVVVGFIIVHLGTMISLDDFKKQWRTFLIGASTVLGIGVALWLAALVFGQRISGSTADGYARASDFVRRRHRRPERRHHLGDHRAGGGAGGRPHRHRRLPGAHRGAAGAGRLPAHLDHPAPGGGAAQGRVPRRATWPRRRSRRRGRAEKSLLPAFLRNTPGTLFVVGIVVLVSLGINNLTDGILNTFVVALIFGILLRTFGVFKPSVLAGIDSLGLMMLAIMILVFGPLATVQVADLKALAFPLVLVFVFGVAGIAATSALVGKLLGYSIPMSVAIGLTALYGFPGTMILSQEAAKGAGESPEEVAAIEHEILPKMIIAGFSTVTITSVIVTSIIAGGIGAG